MDPKAENINTVLFRKGRTEDIIFSVVSVFEDSYTQIKELANTLKGKTIKDSCKNIAEYVINNFTYKVDPEGEQWIKTPARLLADRQADCKSFSIFVCSALNCLGIRNKFRFVSYTPEKQFTHVYSVAYDEEGKELVIDTVAMIQKDIQLFRELKYKHKKDIMNTTKISKLSGVEQEKKTEEERVFRTSDSLAVIFAKTLYFKAKLLKDNRLCTALQSLIYLLQKYDTERSIKLALYKWSDIFVNIEESSLSSQKKLIDTFVDNVGKENSKYLLDSAVLNDPNYIEVENWLNYYIYPYAFSFVPTDPTIAVNQLYDNAFNFLYLFIDNIYLTKKQLQKKQNQAILLETIISNTNINYNAALNLIWCFYTMKFGKTPQNVAAYIFKNIPEEQEEIKIGSSLTDLQLDEDEEEGVYDWGMSEKEVEELANSLTKQKEQSKSNVIKDWIDTAINAFTKIFGTVKGSSNNSNNYVTPVYSDESGSNIFSYFVVGAAVVGAILFVKKNKNTKKAKK